MILWFLFMGLLVSFFYYNFFSEVKRVFERSTWQKKEVICFKSNGRSIVKKDFEKTPKIESVNNFIFKINKLLSKAKNGPPE